MPLPTFSTEGVYAEEVKKTAEQLEVLGLKRKIKTITTEMKSYEKDGEEQELAKLQERLSPLLAKLSQKEQN
jgi:hypothetical protein